MIGKRVKLKHIHIDWYEKYCIKFNLPVIKDGWVGEIVDVLPKDSEKHRKNDLYTVHWDNGHKGTIELKDTENE